MGARERSTLAVASALPHGSSRAPDQAAWRLSVRHSPALDQLRADRRGTTLAVADVLAYSADWASMTTRPTWAVLCARTGRSRATVARALALLRGASLLGVVATGRSAVYVPMALGNQAEAAVYVLAVASPLSLVAGAVDEDETPTGVAGSSDPPGARASQTKSEAEPLRGQIIDAASRPTLPRLHRNDPVWSGTATAQRKDERQAAAGELQRRLPPLRRTSTAWIAAATREFMLAGWTVNDLHHALDHRPDGSRWPHDGATGVQQIGRWLTFRLAVWKDGHGTVLRSPSQRVAAEMTYSRALAVVRAKAHEELMDQRSAPDSPIAAAAINEIRSIMVAARERRWEST